MQEGSPYPKAYSPKLQNAQQPFGRAPVQEINGTGLPPPRAKGKEPARALPDLAEVPLHLLAACKTAELIIPATSGAQQPWCCLTDAHIYSLASAAELMLGIILACIAA